MRVVNKTFNDTILRIIFRDPFKYFKDKRLLICLYIYYIDDLDNARFFVAHSIDLQIIAQTYLVTKKIDIIGLKIFANDAKNYRYQLIIMNLFAHFASYAQLLMASIPI